MKRLKRCKIQSTLLLRVEAYEGKVAWVEPMLCDPIFCEITFIAENRTELTFLKGGRFIVPCE